MPAYCCSLFAPPPPHPTPSYAAATPPAGHDHHHHRPSSSPPPLLLPGTTTTAESLLMGVPVVTLTGACHAHNVSASLLTAVGLSQDWVAHDPDEYVALAMRHAADVPALRALRRSLRGRMLGSRLCDARPFVAELEQVYRQMWSTWSAVGEERGAAGINCDGHQHATSTAAAVGGSGGGMDVLVGQETATTEQVEPAQAAQSQQQLPQQMQMPGPRQQREQQAKQQKQQQLELRDCSPSGRAVTRDCDGDRGSGSGGSDSGSSTCTKAHGARPCTAAGAAGSGIKSGTASGAGGAAGAWELAHKGRKISCSCDAAVTVHAGISNR